MFKVAPQVRAGKILFKWWDWNNWCCERSQQLQRRQRSSPSGLKGSTWECYSWIHGWALHICACLRCCQESRLPGHYCLLHSHHLHTILCITYMDLVHHLSSPFLPPKVFSSCPLVFQIHDHQELAHTFIFLWNIPWDVDLLIACLLPEDTSTPLTLQLFYGRYIYTHIYIDR